MVNLTSKEIKGYSNSKLAMSETNDCFVRALAAGFDINYNKAHELAKERFNSLLSIYYLSFKLISILDI